MQAPHKQLLIAVVALATCGLSLAQQRGKPKSQYKLVNLRLAVGYRDSWFQGERYTSHGYDGMEHAILRRLESRISVADFQRISPTTPAPLPPTGGGQ